MIYLGIDCGTQSLRVVAWNPEEGTLVSASRSYDLIEGLPPGHKEQQPRDWIGALEECVEELRGGGLDTAAVRGIGVSGQQHGFVALDASHQVIRPAKLWCDTSTEAECRLIVEAAGGLEAYQAEIGNALPPGFTASKVLWLRRHEPDSYRRLRHILLPHDYIDLYLTGSLTAEAGDASGTGYFRIREREWSAPALSWIDSDRDLMPCLPPLIASQQPAGQLRPTLAEGWGMATSVKVSSGGGDNMMGAIGTGNVSSGAVTVSLGTSGTIYSYSDRPIIDSRGEIAAFCDGTGGWLPLGCTMNVTVATTMIRHGFSFGSLEDFDRAVESVPPGCDGLLLLPYLEGERMPNVPAGTGVLLGLRPATSTPAHLARAAMEGATLGLRYGLERLRELGIRPAEIRLTGGGARSPVWRRLAADVFGVPVVRPRNEEGPAFGAAIQALWAVEGGDIADWTARYVEWDGESRCRPNPSALELYDRLYRIYQDLSRHLIQSGIFPAHRGFIEGKGQDRNG